MNEQIEALLSEAGVLTIRLANKKTRNALNAEMLLALTEALADACHNSDVRIIVFQGSSWVFSVGADLNMMREEKDKVGELLAEFFNSLWTQSKPCVAVVEGPAMGGGAGILAACDIVLASSKAVFGFPEARLGLMPAVISPYVIDALGKRTAKHLFLSASKFSAEEALRIGLVHVLSEPEDIQQDLNNLLSDLLACGPEAQASIKELVKSVADEEISIEQSYKLSKKIDRMRQQAEAQHGIESFLNKQKPNWLPKDK